MDSTTKWWETGAEVEAIRKFHATEKQHADEVQRWRVTAIIAALFILSLLCWFVNELASKGWH